MEPWNPRQILTTSTLYVGIARSCTGPDTYARQRDKVRGSYSAASQRAMMQMSVCRTERTRDILVEVKRSEEDQGTSKAMREGEKHQLAVLRRFLSSEVVVAELI